MPVDTHYITPVVKYPKVVIPDPHQVRDKLQQESRKNTGCRIKSGMTGLAI